ncbi:DUF4148 domain-containing protein [Noviherbaspirillum cavernae]|uniref:DUF4148 domain-containing protein n=1 Tax=Noviherbaspirillum cavernae TaxID=2320862 RepID=A0A418WX32_9BURK|nr:DUF4148 domain-containing protein [Noviherbaspirillum cavernae]RJG04799.1 DUF4148 domain-containing protein [Noviherbaspirillum cavernae]
MNTKQIVAAVAVLFAAGSALAANDAYVDHSDFTSTRSRAEVRAELDQAYRQGQVAALQNTELVAQPKLASGKSRADVRAELDRAYKSDELARTGGYVEYPQVASIRTREDVRQEALQAARNSRNAEVHAGGN